jgi:DNA replication protein DnaC
LKHILDGLVEELCAHAKPDENPVCPVCGEPTFLRLNTGGWTFSVPRNCACRRFEIEQEEVERANNQRDNAVTAMRSEGLGSAYAQYTFAADDGRSADMRDTCERYVAKHAEVLARNLGLIFSGAPGGGKTFWAAAVANALIDNGVKAWMTTLPQVIAEMTSDYNERRDEVLHRIRMVPFLVLDDLGFERNTSFAREKAFEIINERYAARKPLIVTTNLTKADLEKPTDVGCARVYSRLLEMCPAVVAVRGNRREGIRQEKLDLMHEIMREGERDAE